MTKFLTGLNDGIYETLTWLILLPKTLIKIVLRPKWIVPFIDAELSKDSSERDDEYAPPVVFFIILGVMPGTALLMAWSSALGKLGKAFSSLSFESLIFCIVVFLASWPMASAVVIQWFRGAPISRSGLRPLLFSQFYCWGAMYLVCYLAVPFLSNVFERNTTASPLNDVPFDLPLLGYYVFSFYFYWFAYSEVCIIRAQLGAGTAKAIGVLFVIFFAGMVLMGIVELILLLGILSVAESQASPLLLGI